MSFDDLMAYLPSFGAGTVMVPWWAPAAAGAVLFLFLLLAISRAGAVRVVGMMALIVAVGVGAWFAWSFIGTSGERERVAERLALEARDAALSAQALASGLALACLDGNAGETTENACERVLFAGPESVAAAASYAAARIALFLDVVEYAARRDQQYSGVLVGLRRMLETDRFGFVAQALTQSGCTLEQCDTLLLLRDASRVRANMSERTFDMLVTRYAAGWPTRTRSGPVSSGPTGATGGGAPSAMGLSFPSAASIPPVSIMSSEPPAPPPPPPAPPIAAAPAPAAAAPAVRRPPPPPPGQPKQAAPRPAPPVQLTPSPSTPRQQ